MSIESKHIIKDPIHGVMLFSESEKDLVKKYIDNELFQRLRRIKQLGCGDLVFPGAVHTRFNHSLGVCYLAQKVCNQLNIKDKETRHIIMAAALLHDIGHGPFSHAFEKMCKQTSICDHFKISHDNDWTPKFISAYDKISGKKFNRQVYQFFTGIQCDESIKKYRGIISSQLDVDRLDYLLRDSHFCGVPYGAIDLDWIISCMTITNDGYLGITHKGIGAIEHYVFSRRLMTQNVYYNRKTNASEYLVREFLLSLNDCISESHIKRTSLGVFMNKYFKYLDNCKDRNVTEDVAKKEKIKFIDSAFEQYKLITDDDVWLCMKMLSGQSSKSGQIAKRLLSRYLPYTCELNPSTITKSEEILKKQISKHGWKIYIDKLDFLAYKSESKPIYVKDDPAGSNIFYESSILNHLSDKKETKYALYIDREIDVKEREGICKMLKENSCLISSK